MVRPHDLIAAALLAAVTPVSATADNLPRYQPAAYCKKIAAQSGTYSAWLDNACLDQEQRAYDALKHTWSELPGAVRAHCGKIATYSSAGASYWLLEACVQQEIKARSDAPKFKF